ncbi:MAG: GatB/YqeY domain-containing protein [Burkholderiales bacterium]|nr:GatB/YqeY domain-containing protein [Burkholderiales bacterium]
MSLKQRITDDMKAAMRSRDAARLSCIRMLLAAIKQKEIDDRVELNDTDVLATVERLVKQRRESIAQFQAAGRRDLVDAETFEVDVLTGYLPQRLSEGEIAADVATAVAETGAATARDMGKVMALLKMRLAGRADMSTVSSLLKARLGR